MNSTTMQALRIHTYGNQQVLLEEQVPLPHVAEDDVLIEVVCTSVNPVDWKVREGWLAAEGLHQLPLILGWDVAGRVVQMGKQVSGLQIGSPVYAFGDLSRDGAYAQYISVNAALVAKKPRSLSFAEAASVPLTALTAWQAMHQLAEIGPGTEVLIHGASGGVGSFAVQFAKRQGARVSAVASAANHDYLRALGADQVADYRTPDYLKALGQFDVVFDVVDNDAPGIYDALNASGLYISTLKTHELPSRYHFAHERVLVMPDGDQLAHIGTLIDSGEIKLPEIVEMPFAQIAQAHARSETEHVRGKIVIRL
ncbi:NADP-dependent oxidoreductase [Pseudoalteromonas rubra]|uniref:NADP-dependent oxidoreductase n=1 Tax=Pseudoalteromonas rubra TaxID=43658 RepID=UPI000F79651D|nr:NADP-dependent oxidoreductase [Pseudoalteromonas rubra]